MFCVLFVKGVENLGGAETNQSVTKLVKTLCPQGNLSHFAYG